MSTDRIFDDNDGLFEENKSYKNFRTTLDMGMGGIYMIVGTLLCWAKYKNVYDLPNGYAYVLGGMMIAYGLFRLYRGVMKIIPQKRKF